MYRSFEHYSTGTRARMGKGLGRTLLRVLILLIVLYLVITSMFLTAFQVQSVSMRPLLQPRDRVLASPLVYGARVLFFSMRLPAVRQPARGDLVIVRSPLYGRPPTVVSLFEPLVRFFSFQRGTIVRDPIGRHPPRFMIKRIVAVPGDTVYLAGYKAFVRPAGAAEFRPEEELIDVPYQTLGADLPAGWDGSLPFSGDMEPLTLGEGQYFVLGDNRPSSSDSRSWGALKADQIVAKVLLRYWPFSRGSRL
jgi:signal peptidase I